MILSTAIQSSASSFFIQSSFPYQTTIPSRSFKSSTLLNGGNHGFHPKAGGPSSKLYRLTSYAAPEAVAAETSRTPEAEEAVPLEETQGGVVVKQEKKPRLVLKFIWMEKNIGLALDQVIPGHGTVPMSPYYFWPRKDAWEELKATLESKPWISQKKMIILLNQATDIINLWQQSGGNLTAS